MAVADVLLSVISAMSRWKRNHPALRRRTLAVLRMALAVLAVSAVVVAGLGVLFGTGNVAPGPYVKWEAVGALAGIGAAVAAAATLAVLLMALPDLERNAQDSRVERQPYVRVDVVPTKPHMLTNYQYPKPYFTDSRYVVSLGTDEDTVSVSAIFRNYQPNPLGFAIQPRAWFLLEMSDSNLELTYEALDVKVPYLEFGKPVQVELFRFPRAASATVTCAALGFADIFGRQTLKAVFGGDEATHGRPQCVWDGTRFTADPYAQVKMRL